MARQRRDNANAVRGLVTLRFGLLDLGDRRCETAGAVATLLGAGAGPARFALAGARARWLFHDHGQHWTHSAISAHDHEAVGRPRGREGGPGGARAGELGRARRGRGQAGCGWGEGERWGGGGVDAGFLALGGGDGGGGAGEGVEAGGRLGEGDHVADGLGGREQHAHPVPAERDAAVRRRPVLERVEEEPELRARLGG